MSAPVKNPDNTLGTAEPDGKHMMVVFFSNVTNNTLRAVSKLGIPSIQIPLMTKEAEKFVVDQEYVLIVPAYGDANFTNFVPRQVVKFLNNEQNRKLLKGVIGTGNKNFGREYAVSAAIVSKKCNVPILGEFEIAGTPEDIIEIREALRLENFYPDLPRLKETGTEMPNNPTANTTPEPNFQDQYAKQQEALIALAKSAMNTSAPIRA